jgi:hypothetical protein
MLHCLYQESQDIVRRRLQSALSDIHLSVDIWTSPNNYPLLVRLRTLCEPQGISCSLLSLWVRAEVSWMEAKVDA